MLVVELLVELAAGVLAGADGVLAALDDDESGDELAGVLELEPLSGLPEVEPPSVELPDLAVDLLP